METQKQYVVYYDSNVNTFCYRIIPDPANGRDIPYHYHSIRSCVGEFMLNEFKEFIRGKSIPSLEEALKVWNRFEMDYVRNIQIKRESKVRESFLKSKTILDEAKELVYGERAASYGKVSMNFQRIADLWSPILGVKVTPEQVGLCMIQLKISRQLFKNKRDNLTDIAGYAATLEKMEKE